MKKTLITKYVKNLPTEDKGSVILVHVTEENVTEVADSLYNVHHLPLLSIKAADERTAGNGFVVYYLFGVPSVEEKIILQLALGKQTTFPSLVGIMYEASLYEQEIESFFGLTPRGHPFTQPFILHENWPKGIYPLRKDFPWDKQVEQSKGRAYEFQKIVGEGIYQIPVGPVHAGIIEPGHFRFSVAGEKILSLQPQLGYVHKGSEKLFEVLPLDGKIKLSEHISGDMSFSHSLAFCQALESLANVHVTQYAKYMRVIYSELERIANHINDIGFILNDTAFAFGGSNGMRLKEEIMQINESLTGSRFLRGINTVGGVAKGVSQELLDTTVEKLQVISHDFTEFITIAEDTETVMNRLMGTGYLSPEIARDHGVVGMAARMLGVAKDSRVQYPYAAYKELETKICLQQRGDVYARFQLRIDEVYESIRLIAKAVQKLKKEKFVMPVGVKNFANDSFAVGISEGWRGEIVYFVMTDRRGVVSRVGVRDPSFLNWPAVPYAVAGNIVPDFPLINKSFNLSYSGFDR